MKERVFTTDRFDVLISDISSLSTESSLTNNGIVYHIEIRTKSGKSFFWPNDPAKTEEEAIKLKTKLSDALFNTSDNPCNSELVQLSKV